MTLDSDIENTAPLQNTLDPSSSPSSPSPADKITDKDMEEFGYNSTPSYPIFFSFSEELQAIVNDNAAAAEEAKATVRQYQAMKQPRTTMLSSSSLWPPSLLSSNQPVQQQHKKHTNLFAGPSIAAALAGRGFGHLTSKKSMPLSPQQPRPQPQPQPPVGSPTKKQRSPPQLTLEKHYKLLTRQCEAIFEEPEEAVAKSMKIVHTLGLLASDLNNNTTTTTATTSTNTIMTETTRHENDDSDELSARNLKLATRYCYHRQPSSTRRNRAIGDAKDKDKDNDNNGNDNGRDGNNFEPKTGSETKTVIGFN
ncbi:hypothetical protein BGZ65_008331 [Modicella reniformis]|uniref:Uncharacterized protein n=1 Tax=Modicella reniformis TaxID=1440133 RepID=A0A9P6IU56_9FUNG|nr:hypothetical protein BGZ65_008331 [Modicella reniformis]